MAENLTATQGVAAQFRLESGSAISADALFVELTTVDGAAHTPEVFPRADGTTYVCALSSQ